MKKIFAISIIIILYSANSFAYQRVFENGTKTIQAGIGFPDFAGGYGEDTLIPPINVAFDYGVMFRSNIPVSFGGMAAYARDYHTEKSGSTEYKWTYDYFFIGFRGAFHFTELITVDYLDLYAGVIAGWIFVDSKYKSSDNSPYNDYNAKGDRFNSGIFGGARYYLTENIGVFAEASFEGIGLFNLGVVSKF